jgi:hypothetical protein
MAATPYTTVAGTVAMNTGLLTSRLSGVKVGSQGRVLKVQEPSGPSTQGGRNARQALMLSAGAESPVIGWVDFGQGTGEVKNYESVLQAWSARYARPFDVTRENYADFRAELLAQLKALKVQVSSDAAESLEVTDQHAAFVPPSGEEESSPVKWVVVVCLVLGVAMAWFLSRR